MKRGYNRIIILTSTLALLHLQINPNNIGNNNDTKIYENSTTANK